MPIGQVVICRHFFKWIFLS